MSHTKTGCNETIKSQHINLKAAGEENLVSREPQEDKELISHQRPGSSEAVG